MLLFKLLGIIVLRSFW